MATRSQDCPIVCLTGPESTGKSQLALQVGAALAAPVVPEFARGWLERRGGRYNEASLAIIAAGQLAAEAAALDKVRSAPLIVADTDLQVLEVWWGVRFASPSWQRRYALRAPPIRLYPNWLQQALRRQAPRYYLLAKPDIAWEPDPLRESNGKRRLLFDHYQRVLRRDNAQYRVVAGQAGARLQSAMQGIQQLGLLPP